MILSFPSFKFVITKVGWFRLRQDSTVTQFLFNWLSWEFHNFDSNVPAWRGFCRGRQEIRGCGWPDGDEPRQLYKNKVNVKHVNNTDWFQHFKTIWTYRY